MEEVGKAMALCFVKHKTQEIDNYKFEFVSEDSWGWTKINMYRNSELIASPNTIVYADHHLHPEKLYKRCEERVGWIMLKYWARETELEGTDLYEYLASKCVEEGITLDILNKHSEDILKRV